MRRPATGLIRRAYGSTFADDEIDDLYSSAWLGTLRALKRRHSELDDEAIRSYLLTAVANQASKEIRRRKRKPVAPLEAAGMVAELADTPEDAVAAKEDDNVTKDVLSSLPPRRRAVMLLRYGWGLEPKEVCGMIDGLSPRAYRKEVTRGVDQLASRIKLVEDGRWCKEREPVLKAYAAGIADPDQTIQAQHHLSHCRHCQEFVGKLTGQLHDLGSAIALPGALEALDNEATLLERLGGAADRIRDAAAGVFSRPESSEAIAGATQVRGAGAAAAGVTAKLAGLGTAAKVSLACLGGGVAATACVAAGILPTPIAESEGKPVKRIVSREIAKGPLPTPPVAAPVQTAVDKPPPTDNSVREAPEPAAVAQPQPVLAPETPPELSEFGVESGAAPTSSSSSSPSPASAATTEEFGP